jgi:hypothetical protein
MQSAHQDLPTCACIHAVARLKYLAERCWAELPEVRPSLTQLYNELENLQVQLCPGGQDASRLVVQSCIKPKRPPSNVPPVQMAGQKAAQQMSRLAQVGLGGGTWRQGERRCMPTSAWLLNLCVCFACVGVRL